MSSFPFSTAINFLSDSGKLSCLKKIVNSCWSEDFFTVNPFSWQLFHYKSSVRLIIIIYNPNYSTLIHSQLVHLSPMTLRKKTSLLQILVLALIFFAAYSIKNRRAVAENNNAKPYVCQPRDRTPRPCPQYVVQGCICYTDGSCSNGHVNSCTDCARPGVYSVLEGQSCLKSNWLHYHAIVSNITNKVYDNSYYVWSIFRFESLENCYYT